MTVVGMNIFYQDVSSQSFANYWGGVECGVIGVVRFMSGMKFGFVKDEEIWFV